MKTEELGNLTLTKEQRARRRATRINNKIRRKFPLLARGAIDNWFTTPEQELACIQEIDRGVERWMQQWDEKRQEIQAVADCYRESASHQLSSEQLAALDKHREIYPASPEYAANFWHSILNELMGRPEGIARPGTEVLKILGARNQN